MHFLSLVSDPHEYQVFTESLRETENTSTPVSERKLLYEN